MTLLNNNIKISMFESWFSMLTWSYTTAFSAWTHPLTVIWLPDEIKANHHTAEDGLVLKKKKEGRMGCFVVQTE